MRDYMRKWYAKKVGRTPRRYTRRTIEHGLTGYRDHGCRCEVCIAANRQQTADVEAWRRRANRAPIGPLLERAASVAGRDPQAMSLKDIGRVCGVDGTQIYRWMQSGSLPFRNAEQVAIHLGWHPAAIWGIDWYLMEDAA